MVEAWWIFLETTTWSINPLFIIWKEALGRGRPSFDASTLGASHPKRMSLTKARWWFQITLPTSHGTNTVRSTWSCGFKYFLFHSWSCGMEDGKYFLFASWTLGSHDPIRLLHIFPQGWNQQHPQRSSARKTVLKKAVLCHVQKYWPERKPVKSERSI